MNETEIKNKLTSFCEEITGSPVTKLDQNLLRTGYFDSIEFLDFISRVETEFKIKVSHEFLAREEVISVATVSDYCLKTIQKN